MSMSALGADSNGKWQPSMTSLKQRLEYVFHAKLFTDIWISVRKVSSENWTLFPANKMILAASSPVFSSMFYGEYSEFRKDLSFEDVSPSGFRTMLRYIYTDEAVFSNATGALKTCEVAKRFKILALQVACEVFLMQIKLAPREVCRVLQYAEVLKMHSLKQKCLEITQEIGSSVVLSNDFLNCSSETLKSILSLPHFQRRYGYDVFESVFRWATNKAENNKSEGFIPRDFVFQLLPKLNFLTLSVDQFHTLHEKYKFIFTKVEAAEILNSIIIQRTRELPSENNLRTLEESLPNLILDSALESTADLIYTEVDDIPKLYQNAKKLYISLRITGKNHTLLLPGVNIYWKVFQSDLPVNVTLLFLTHIYKYKGTDKMEGPNYINERVSIRMVNESYLHAEFTDPFELLPGQFFIINMKAEFHKPVTLLMADSLCNVSVCSPHMTAGYVCEFSKEILFAEVISRQFKPVPTVTAQESEV